MREFPLNCVERLLIDKIRAKESKVSELAGKVINGPEAAKGISQNLLGSLTTDRPVANLSVCLSFHHSGPLEWGNGN